MGVDAIIEFRFNPKKQNLTDLNYRFREANPGIVYDYDELNAQRSAFIPTSDWQGGYNIPYVMSVRTMERWYGPGYERGQWPLLSMAIRWLLLNTEEVWYYSDYVGDRPNSIDISFVDEMDRHWAKVGGLPYRGYMNETSMARDDRKNAPVCCGYPTEPWIWGGGKVGYYCLACHTKHGWNPHDE